MRFQWAIASNYLPDRAALIAAALGCCLPMIGPVVSKGARAQAAAPAKPAAQPAKPAAPVARQATPANSLDDALLDDLDNELLDGVKDLPVKKANNKKPTEPGREKPPGDGKSSADADGDQDAAHDGAGRDHAGADGEMAEGDAAGGEEPLIRIGQQMRTVEKLIEQQQASGNTEHLQGQILSDLAELIKKLGQQSQSASSSKSSNSQAQPSSRETVKQPKPGSGNPGSQASNKPAKESTERLGKNDVQKPDADAVKGMLKDAWGQLPPHARELMLQSPPEQFLPKYELLIEKYYKRLADEQKQKP